MLWLCTRQETARALRVPVKRYATSELYLVHDIVVRSLYDARH